MIEFIIGAIIVISMDLYIHRKGKMDLGRIKVALRRFLKVFVASGLAQVAIAIGPGLNIASLEDVQKVGLMLANAFLAGAILGLLKAVQYQP